MKKTEFILLIAVLTLLAIMAGVIAGKSQLYLNDSVWFDTTTVSKAVYGADLGKWDVTTHPFFADLRKDWRRYTGYGEGDTTPWGIQHYKTDMTPKIDSLEQKIITWGNPDIIYEGDWVLSEDCLCAWNAWPSDTAAKIKYRFYGDDIRMYGQNLPHLGELIFEIDGEPWLVNQCCYDDSLAMNIDFQLELGYHDVVIQPINGYIVFRWFIINFKPYVPPADPPTSPAKLPIWAWIIIGFAIVGITVFLIVRK